MNENARNCVVSISSDGENPMIFGPYTRRRAEKLAAQFNERIDSTQFEFVWAGALRINNPGIVGILKEFGQ